MSYQAVTAAQNAVLAAVSGIKYALEYAPRSIQATPMIYSILDSFEPLWDQAIGETPAYRYRRQHRLVLAWQENEASELELEPFVNSIPEAVNTNRNLGGILRGGVWEIEDGTAGWQEINGVWYRTVDFFSETLEQPA